MRSMVEGHPRLIRASPVGNTGTCPSTTLRVVPLPVPGRIYRPCRAAIALRHSSAVGMIGLSTRWRIFHSPSSRTNSSS